MNDFRITTNIEPTDKYQKAKNDCLQAANSMQALTNEEQKQLAEELFGATRVQLLLKAFRILSQYRF